MFLATLSKLRGLRVGGSVRFSSVEVRLLGLVGVVVGRRLRFARRIWRRGSWGRGLVRVRRSENRLFLVRVGCSMRRCQRLSESDENELAL